MAQRDFLFVSWSGFITDIASQALIEAHAVTSQIRADHDRDIDERRFEVHDRLHARGCLRES